MLGLCRNSVRAARKRYQFCGPPCPYRRKHKTNQQPNALSATERQEIKDTLLRDEYANQPPIQVYYHLLELGKYLCSISTMHRILREDQMSGERRNQRPPSQQITPRLGATAPNQVWCWDITKLGTQKRGEYLSLYVVMDLFSRHIVAWMLSRKENSALASQLIAEAHERYVIMPDTLTLHQDRGAPMTARYYLELLGELAITASHSRSRVSNDNAFSESQFKTMKYQPDYPRKFNGFDYAMRWCEDYVNWYNTQHHHSALEGFTPLQVFTGEYLKLSQARQDTLDHAYAKHPDRFTKGRPTVRLPQAVFINPIPMDANQETLARGVNFPTLKRVIEKQSNF